MSPGSLFRVSLCICTRNRVEALRTALASARSSTIPVWEVVVSDDSTDGQTADVVRSCFPEVRYLKGPQRGLGANRNCAVSVCTGTHVLFLDDDAALSPDFLEQMRAEAGDTARLILTGGERTEGRCIYPSDMGFLGYLDRPRTIASPLPLQGGVMNACIFPLSLFAKIGFDETLIYGWEEIDFFHRAIRQGYAIRLLPTAINEHYSSPVNRAEYFAYRETSRLYAMFKLYYYVERNRPKASLFAVWGVLHLMAHSLRVKGIKSLREVQAAIRTAAAQLARYRRTPKDRAPLRESGPLPEPSAGEGLDAQTEAIFRLRED